MQWLPGRFDPDIVAIDENTVRQIAHHVRRIRYLPASADYDGDGLADPAIYAPGTADLQVLMSATLATQGVYTWCDTVLITIGGVPVSADYDGDGLADPAVYHEDTPSAGSTSSLQAGSGQAGWWEIFLSACGYQEILSGYFGGPTCEPALE